MDRALELVRVYEGAPTNAAAEEALDELRERGVPAGVSLGDLYDELATEAAEDDEFEIAASAERKACELGCEHPELAREMLGWYLLKAGELKRGEEQFAELRAERGPEDLGLLLTIANARLDSGLGESALLAFDEALALAKRSEDPDLLADVRAERRDCRRELGLAADGDDEAVPPAPLGIWPGLEDEQWVLAWFPRPQCASAIKRWPDLEDDLRDPDGYCARMEAQLRDLQRSTGRAPLIAPLDIGRLVSFAERAGLDPSTPAARSRFAAEAGRSGTALAWPPGRNERCWCGSGEKYKRCCGAR